MAIKDYKSQAPETPPSPKKQAEGSTAFKKTMVAFGIGFSLGLLVAAALCMNYLDTKQSTIDNDEEAKQPAPKATDNKEPAEPAPSINQSIDYQFYEVLKNFELAPPDPDQPSQDEVNNLLPEINEYEKTPQKVESKASSPPRYILQAGTFMDAEKAQTQRRKIVDLGHKAVHIFQTTFDNKQYYRVWLGPYTDEEKAQAIGRALKAAHVEVVLRHDLRNFEPKEQ